MAGRGGYNTKTRQLILDYLINNRQHAVSVDLENIFLKKK